MKRIHWIASYPKSGNTWLRLMLQAYLAGGEAIDINRLTLGAWRTAGRAWFDEHIGVAASDLTGSEILALRPAAIRAWARTLAEPVYLKTHEARLALASDDYLTPADISLGGIYLMRDPRDVALSLARHLDVEIDEAITVMGTPDQRMEESRHRLRSRLVDQWGSWSQNVGSWIAPDPFPVHVVRYEEMRADPEATLCSVLSALGLPIVPETVRAVVAATTLDRLRAQEAANAFVEWQGKSLFFGDGRVHGWRDRLSADQVARIETRHGAVMRMAGYLE